MVALMTRHSKNLALIKIIILLAIPIVLWVLPAEFFDDGPPMCLSVLLFDQECFACGMTRSIMHLMHFDLSESLYHSPVGIVVLPLLFWVWQGWLRNAYKQFKAAG